MILTSNNIPESVVAYPGGTHPPGFLPFSKWRYTMNKNKYAITSNGELITYAWPGGYPVIYLTEDSGVLCPDCANGKNDSEAYLDIDGRGRNGLKDPQWEICAADVHWEGDPIPCDHCNAEIESAYGTD
tara:strand:- start:71 stop:457 length:387 start_codon:yes stop_codon:yes gene_type:complete